MSQNVHPLAEKAKYLLRHGIPIAAKTGVPLAIEKVGGGGISQKTRS